MNDNTYFKVLLTLGSLGLFFSGMAFGYCGAMTFDCTPAAEAEKGKE